MANKKDKVMEALSHRGSLDKDKKKGVSLLHIVKKLTDKRTAKQDKDGKGGPGTMPALPSQANVPSKTGPAMPTLPSQAKGTPARQGRPFMQ